jgi:hypothetical protein
VHEWWPLAQIAAGKNAGGRLLPYLAQRLQQRGALRLREFAEQRLMHDPGVDDQGTVPVSVEQTRPSPLAAPRVTRARASRRAPNV